MRASSRGAALFACALLLPAAASALPFVVELLDLQGVIEERTDPRADDFRRLASFDFGQQFESIESVAIEIDATVHAHERDLCDYFPFPESCIHVFHQPGFSVFMDAEGMGTGFVLAGVEIGDFHAPVVTGTGRSTLLHPNTPLDFLLDGKGQLSVYWNSPAFFDKVVIVYQYPFGEITGARLILEATPIPEPTTSALIASGILWLAAKHRRRKKASADC